MRSRCARRAWNCTSSTRHASTARSLAVARSPQIDRRRRRRRIRQRTVRGLRVGRRPRQAPRTMARHRRGNTRPRRRGAGSRVRADVGRMRSATTESVLPEPTVERAPQGNVRVHVVAGVPGAAGPVQARSVARVGGARTLWLTDAYFVGTSAYTHALRAAAADGVDVRLLVPGARDIPALSPFRALAIGRCSKPACGFSSGTARCCTPRPPWRTAYGHAWDRPTSIWRAGCPTTNSMWRSRMRPLLRRWLRRYEADIAHARRSC